MDISKFQSNLDFIKSLYFHEEWKDEDCKKEILEALEEANEKIEKAFGKSMHFLHNHKPSVEAVEKLTKKIPSTLSYTQEEYSGQIPIQTAATSDAFDYVPVLAKEGMKHKVGGDNARGALLTMDPVEGVGWNTLKCLVNVGDQDEDRTRVLKELRKAGLLLKKDIQEQNLLEVSCWEGNKKRFEYLVSWDPDALIETRIRDKPFIHYISSQSEEASIILALKNGFKHHPNTGGLLFVEDDWGTTAFDCMCDAQGEEKTVSFLHDILSPTRDYPILHHVFIHVPEHKDLFMEKFPWSYHLKDHNGRTLHQAVLAAGPDVMSKNHMILASLSDNQIQTKDPVTTLYPFAAMAVGEHADLENTFYLLRRQPSVMDRHSRSEIGSSSKRRKRRKTQK